jgi:hypothetical protein
MVDIETFLTCLFVLVDDFCLAHPLPFQPGPDWKLSASEAITLLIFGQWARFRSERDFYRFARQKLCSAFPNLPSRPQLNRQWQALHDQACAFLIYLADLLGAQEAPYEALDLAPIVVRDAKRRGTGWLAGEADIGKSNRLGWYEGLKMPLAVTPKGVITGFGVAPASAKEQPIAETFFYLRAHPTPRFASVGHTSRGRYYPTDKGFEGRENRQRWEEAYGARVIHAPKHNSRRPWPKALRRRLAGIRQIVETVVDKLLNTFRLDRERPHSLQGLRTRLAAKVSLHNFCIWLNRQLGRPDLAFADLLGWA